MISIEGYKITGVFLKTPHFTLFRAIKRNEKKPVILKICNQNPPSPIHLAELEHEYHLLSILNLSNVIHTYGIQKDIHSNHLILELEDLEGVLLKEYLANKPLSIDEFFNLSIQIVDAINELHLKNIIHKNINPYNIVINPKTKKLTLIDLSIASQFIQKVQSNTALNKLEGNLAYLSPEQTGRMNHSVDYRTDFYSLGITLYEMLTATLPFQTDDILDLIHSHLVKKAVAVNTVNQNVPGILAIMIEKLLSKLPEERYVSAAGLKSDLIKCQMIWEKEHAIDSFPLAKEDIQDHLIISQKLYGREKEIAQLKQIFEEVTEGKSQLLLISGYSGIGKTSLIKEIYKPITKKKGYFVSGKYDQLQRSIPYSGFIEAFKELIERLLDEPEKKLISLRKEFLQILGENGQIIIDLIPNMELIIGPQSPAKTLPTKESFNRFQFLFQELIKVIAKSEHPLVIFFDDLQWIDNASLKLMHSLISNDETRYFLIIGAYRDNEITFDHPLALIMQELEKAGIKINQLKLNPLNETDIQDLLSDSLNDIRERMVPLAHFLWNQTHGNPFFINESLKKIYHEKLLTYSYQLNHWQWDIQKIQKISVSDNVVDLLVKRICELPYAGQNSLKFAACIGHRFDLTTLAIVSNASLAETTKGLMSALEYGLITIITDNFYLFESISNESASKTNVKFNFCFVHDRIQQAAYQLIPKEEKKKVHLQIGSLLLKTDKSIHHSKNIFNILNHFNYSISLVTDPNEILSLMKLNLIAGKKAKASTAFQQAKEYFQTSATLLDQLNSSIQENYYFDIHKELAITHYLTSNFFLADQEFKALFEKASSLFLSLEINKLQCEMLATLNKHEEAISLGLKSLEEVNIRVPGHPSILTIMQEVARIHFKIRDQNIRAIELVPMSNKDFQSATDLISQIFNSSFITNQNLFILLACINVRLSLNYGRTESTSFAFYVYAFAIMHGLGWYQTALDFTELANKLALQYTDSPFEGKNGFILACFINPWRLPIEKSFSMALDCYQQCREFGDYVYGNYASLLIIMTASMMGKPVSEIRQYLKIRNSFINRSNANDFRQLTIFSNYFYDALEKPILNFDEVKLLEKSVLNTKNYSEISIFYTQAIKTCYLLSNFHEAIEFGKKFKKYAEYTSGALNYMEGFFYYVLSITAYYNNKKTAKFYFELFRTTIYFKKIAKWCPENFEHYKLLLLAEINRFKKSEILAIKLYNKSIELAKKRNAFNIAAISHERLGELYFELNADNAAMLNLVEAHSLYNKLEIKIKILSLEKSYPELLNKMNPITLTPLSNQDLSQENSNYSLDILSIIKATRAISSEIKLEKLLTKLLIILLQNAGADRGVFIEKEDSSWYIKAEGNVSTQKILLSRSSNLDDRIDLPLSLMRYVLRTEKARVIQSKDDFSILRNKDAYLNNANVKSILVIPIHHKGKLQSILYLENKTLNNVFTAEKIHTLQILSSQAAISLENARLYYLATHDPLTGLANRNLLYQTFESVIIKNTKRTIAILFFDLDNFKPINDSLGHAIGDKVLLYFSEQLKSSLRPVDLGVRLGGDEFVVMLNEIEINEVNEFSDRFLQRFKNPVDIHGNSIHLKLSIGISLFPIDGDNIIDLLKKADTALYRVKAQNKGSYQFYSSHLNLQVKSLSDQEHALWRAFEAKEFCVYYQPIFSAKNNKIVSFEALLRWNNPDKGIEEAKSFITLAEKSGLILPLTTFVLKTVCYQIKDWISENLAIVPIAINISGLQINKKNVISVIFPILQETQLDPRTLQFELTENIFIGSNDIILDQLNQLKSAGFKLILDDFGMEYSSLSYLRRLPVDKIKIPQTFIDQIGKSDVDEELISLIISIGHKLKLSVVAEGVENEEQVIFLKNKTIDELQGNYLGKPLDSIKSKILLDSIFNER